ncbi:MAG: FIST N-terminal domain-containing protein [Bacteroidales bacterium]
MEVTTIKGHFVNEIEQELSNVLLNKFNPDLAIVFCSVSQNINGLCKLFKKNDIELIGATTAGEIYNHTVLEKAIVALLIKLDRSSYEIASFVNKDKDLRALGEKASQNANERFTDPTIIVFSGGVRADGEELVRGLTNNLSSENKIYGALAGDDLNLAGTYVFTSQTTIDNGIVCLYLDGSKIQAEGLATSGWESIGTEKLITKSRGNVVFSIDHKPALDVFMDYFNKPKERLVNSDMVVNELAQYPLQVKREENYSVLRAPLIADTDKGALIFSGTVEEGSKIKFSVPPGFETIESSTQEILGLKDNFPKAEAVLVFSCKARHQALGPLVEEELEGIQNIWEVPLIGFFSYGEIGNLDGYVCDFHNETISFVALKEL